MYPTNETEVKEVSERNESEEEGVCPTNNFTNTLLEQLICSEEKNKKLIKKKGS